ncbi:MAG: tetratricopeptide repeat protein [Spirochaetales bacterium]|nr:tetratricopeptide repeat protein [Spirochaetales bacterium]
MSQRFHAPRFRSVWVPIVLVLGVLLFSGCSANSTHLQVLYANYSFQQGNYLDATVRYLNSLDDPQFHEFVVYNLGNVYFALGEFSPALNLWVEGENSQNLELLYRTAFNKGVLFYEQQEFSRARESFITALLLDPGSLEAKINLELSLDKLESGRQTPVPRTDPSNRPTENTPDSQSLRVFDYLRRKEGQQWTPTPQSPQETESPDW